MIKLNSKVRLQPKVYDTQDGLVEWLKYYMGDNIDYYNIIWVVNKKIIDKDSYVLRDEKWGLNVLSFTIEEMIEIGNALSRLKKRYAVYK